MKGTMGGHGERGRGRQEASSVIAKREALWQSHSKALHFGIAQPVPSEAKESSTFLAMTGFFEIAASFHSSQ